jgi:four helix bundle protein
MWERGDQRGDMTPSRSSDRTRDYRDLIVWPKAMRLTEESYAIARRLPMEERFELAAQIRRSASSVGANVAEGHSRPYRREFLRFLGIACASVKELQHHLLVVVNVGYAEAGEVRSALALCEEISRMTATMRRRLIEEFGDAPTPPRISPKGGITRREETMLNAER